MDTSCKAETALPEHREHQKNTFDCTNTRETNTRYYRRETTLSYQVHVSAAYDIKFYKTSILKTSTKVT